MSKIHYSDEQLKQNKKTLKESLDKSMAEQSEAVKNYDEKPLKIQLDRLPTDDRSDDELLEAVKTKLNAKYGTLVSDANRSNAKKINDMNELIKKAEADAQKRKAEESELYANAEKAVENDALKRGIARSSIANGAVAEIEKSKADAVSAVEKTKYAKQSELKEKIESLQSELEELMKNYDLQMAAEQEELYEKAKKERDSANEIALKYNNTITEKEVNYQDTEAAAAIQKEKEKVEEKYFIDRLNKITAYYRDFDDKSKALDDFLSDDGMREYLGKFYNTAYKMIYNM
ncbi:MAG: hypothetical protein J5762_03940 [Clostridia bacterium]|nr:hypothetical protein [Clostridia bacterium]